GDGAEDFGGVLPALGTGGDDQVRAAERCERLSQRPRRQELAIAPRVLRARHHDLEVFLERAVLERVVEDDRGDAEPVEREARRVVAVRAHDHRHARQATREQEWLVARLLGVEPDRRRVSDDPDATGARKRPTSSSVSRTAPWREAMAPYPASPVFALSPASARSRVSSRPSSPPSRTTHAAPTDSRSAADSRKFCVCGPMSTGFRLS